MVYTMDMSPETAATLRAGPAQGATWRFRSGLLWGMELEHGRPVDFFVRSTSE